MSNQPQGMPIGKLSDEVIVQAYNELLAKYKKVKGLYFDKTATVESLEKSLENQRVAVSRTVLDDNEYKNRFKQLDGAVKDLAFSLQSHWRVLPPWLSEFVTEDTILVGTKNSMALGRAIITQWISTEIFQRYFHPGLDASLSRELKSIEMNLRPKQPWCVTDDHCENTFAKLSIWRQTTLKGLYDKVSSSTAQEHRTALIENLTVELASFLKAQLQMKALPRLDAGSRLIVEKTIKIIDNIPQEGREVYVEYFSPNFTFQNKYMQVEGQLQPLGHPSSLRTDQEVNKVAAADEDPSTSVFSSTPDKSLVPCETRRKTLVNIFSGPQAAGKYSSAPEIKGESKLPKPSNIHFASFFSVKACSEGVETVLIKAPVWLMD